MRTKTFILYYSTFLFGLQDPFSVLVKFLTGAVCISGMIPNAAGAAACRSEKEALREYFTEYLDWCKKKGVYIRGIEYTNKTTDAFKAKAYYKKHGWDIYISKHSYLKGD